jgi:hypothetical protein
MKTKKLAVIGHSRSTLFFKQGLQIKNWPFSEWRAKKGPIFPVKEWVPGRNSE